MTTRIIHPRSRITCVARFAAAMFAVAVLGLFTQSASAVVVADIAADYVASTAPAALPPGWAYFESDTPDLSGGTNLALNPNSSVGDQGETGFASPSNGLGLGLAAVLGTNTNGGDYEIFSDGNTNHGGVVGTDLLVHPGTNEDPRIRRRAIHAQWVRNRGHRRRF